MTRRSLLAAAVLAGLALAGIPSAQAVIKVEFPVSKMYDTSQAVIIGTVAAANPDNRVVDVTVTGAAKGDAGGDRLRIQIVNPPELIKQAAPGSPLVLFVAKERGGAMALLHLADTWLMANRVPGSDPPAWRVVQPHDAKQSFPGRTAALVRLVEAIKAGRPAMLNHFDPEVFRGGVRQLAALGVAKPTFLVAADLSGDKKPDLVVGTADGARLFLAAGAAFEDATAARGLAGAAGSCAAAADADGDGHVDLLLGRTLWMNDGQKFTQASAALGDGPPPAAVALADVTGDAKPDAVLLLANGQVLTFENPGGPDKPWRPLPAKTLWQDAAVPVAAEFGDWGDDGRPCLLVVRAGAVTRYALDADGPTPADFERLTGTPFTEGHKAHLGRLEKVAAVRVDSNGDRRPDFLLVAETGMLLVNRGFGAFFANAEAGQTLVSHESYQVPFDPLPPTRWAAADLHGDGLPDLVVLTEDGRLFEVGNTRLPASK